MIKKVIITKQKRVRCQRTVDKENLREDERAKWNDLRKRSRRNEK